MGRIWAVGVIGTALSRRFTGTNSITDQNDLYSDGREVRVSNAKWDYPEPDSLAVSSVKGLSRASGLWCLA